MQQTLYKTAWIQLLVLIFCTPLHAQTWSPKATYPVTAGADGGFCFSINNKIYLGGGLGSKQFWRYDPDSNKWARMADIGGVSTDRSFATSFVIGGKGYVGLGLDGSTQKTDLWAYDPATNGWSPKKNYPGSGRDGLFSFVIGNTAYVGAGEDAFTQTQNNEVYAYDGPSDTWTQKHDYPTAGIIYPFSFAIAGKGYVACGAESAEVTTVYEYNPAGDSWTPIAPFTGSARQGGVAFVLNGKAYCGTGFDLTMLFSDFYSYDPATNKWNIATPMPTSGRGFGGAAVANGKGYAGTGFASGTAVLKDWYEYAVPTSVKGINSSGNLFYPNPVVDVLHLNNYPAGSVLSCTVQDCTGKTVMQVTKPNRTLNVSGLPPGTYVLYLQLAEGMDRCVFEKGHR